jgi:hypothetical protein
MEAAALEGSSTPASICLARASKLQKTRDGRVIYQNGEKTVQDLLLHSTYLVCTGPTLRGKALLRPRKETGGPSIID